MHKFGESTFADTGNFSRIGQGLAMNHYGSNKQTVQHFVQLLHGKNFAYFDYGKDKNVDKYGQEAPPEVDISKLSVPTAVLIGKTDQITKPEDTIWAKEQIEKAGKLVGYHEYPFGHQGFAFSNTRTHIDDSLELIKKYHF
jgi:hypothetical protein